MDEIAPHDDCAAAFVNRFDVVGISTDFVDQDPGFSRNGRDDHMVWDGFERPPIFKIFQYRPRRVTSESISYNHDLNMKKSSKIENLIV